MVPEAAGIVLASSAPAGRLPRRDSLNSHEFSYGVDVPFASLAGFCMTNNPYCIAPV